MNREILFRGFHECEDGTTTIIVDGKKVKGDWAYGNLCIEEKHTFITFNYINALGNFGTRYRPVISVIVIKKTVGQYTGLTGKNGKKIFEGDIVKNYHNNAFKVFYENFSLKIEDSFGCVIKTTQSAVSHFEVEIIGNIHNNPELLDK